MSDLSTHEHHGAGERLRAAREAAGLTQAEVATRLHMPARVVKSLEEEDWSRLGAPVFVRGQLHSYSKLLGLSTAPVVEAAGVAPIEPPKLVPRSYTSPLERFAEHAARRMVYIVMTAAIAIPVWLATRPHLDLVAHDAAPLDVAAPANAGKAPAARRHRPANVDPRPVVASLASLPAREDVLADGAMSLSFSGDSWIEVTDRDGKLLEQALVHAGDHRRYAAGEVGSMLLGNASVVELRQDGQDADLSPYMRANVARFTVSSDGSLAAAAD